MRNITIFLFSFVLIICCTYSSMSEEIYDDSVFTFEGEVKRPIQQEKKLIRLRKNRDIQNIELSPLSGKMSYKLNVKAKAYCIRGFTSRGVYTRKGVIAVDPRVIPFGSKIYVPGYGWGVAQDTGGAIKGKIIDIWFPSYSQCLQWGVRDVTVIVVKP